ncbi:hypothetical protein FSPOR_4051 [Fusarium sporotrichioides]|uniref:Uncharacterized protein n=1 Tax=Fusarium sporotrichioides TaxID=5514 RepID=A0A395SDI2_FUSSP|nr:hypothetical protein FSPOR_4051 [Fusarium sporotrichioides]
MPSAAPSSAMSLSKPTPHPTTLVIEPNPTDDDDLSSDWTFPPMTTPWTGPPDCTWTYDANHVSMSGMGGLEAMLDLQPIAGAKSLSCYPDAMFDNGLTGVYSPVRTGTMRRLRPSAAPPVPYTFNQTAQTYDAHAESATTLYSATIAVYTIRALFKDRDKDALGLKDEDDIPGVEHHNDSLSLGERIGIGVGVAVFVLLAVGGLAFWLIHRERARTEKRRPHELNAVGNMRHSSSGAGDDFYTAAEANHQRNRSRGNTEPPPPAYAATDSNSMTENDSRLSEDTTTRDEEIRALQIQKEAIQRRLQQLEQADIQNQTDNRHN